MRGRIPKPNEIKIAEGNPGKRRIKNSPKPERVLGLKCPALIRKGKHGKEEWQRVTVELSRMGMLTVIDFAGLEMYCRAFQKWHDAEDFLIEKGTVYTLKDNDGRVKYIQQLPQVSIAQQCQEYCRKMIQEFGLSPAARSRLEIKPRELADSDLAAFAATLDG